MDNALTKMLEFSFTAEPKPDVLDILTNAETRGYEHLKAEVGVEGYVSISALVEKTAVSRPTYNNLLSKLKNKGYAEVVNKGVKGTYIRFI
jgi:GTP-sensing pleiotropic transcriptional regulator CodY